MLYLKEKRRLYEFEAVKDECWAQPGGYGTRAKG
jgi:hypothetical protein